MADHKELENIDEKSRLNEESDAAKIKFQPSKNGEAKIELPGSAGVGYQCGLTKEELMKYANDPFWVAMRRVLFVLFWLLWIAMLVGAVAIIIVTPGCERPKEPEWYEEPIYELRVDGFFDSDGNQKGDLAGIIKKQPYFDEISVSAVVLDGLFNKDAPTIIDPDHGSFDDFQALSKLLKLIVKLPISGIDFSSEKKQAEFVDALKFWLGKGAAGFVFDELELISSTPELKDLTGQWHKLVSNFSSEDFPRVTILSSYTPLDENDFSNHTNMVLNYKPMELVKQFTPEQLVGLLQHTVEKNKTSSCRSNLVLSNGDIQPLINRFDSEERDRLILFSLLADATPFIYFGDEYANSDPDLPSVLTRGQNKMPHPMNWKTIEDMKSGNKSNNFFKLFKKAAKLRKDETSIRVGETSLKILGDKVVGMSRIKKGNPGFAIVTNFGDTIEEVNLRQLDSHIPEKGQIDIVSTNSHREEGQVTLNNLQLKEKETLVLQFVAKFEAHE